MTELEQLFLTNLERLEAEQQNRFQAYNLSITQLENRVQDLEQYAPQLRNLCEELNQLLERLNKSSK